MHTANLAGLQSIQSPVAVKLQDAKDVQWLTHLQAVTALLNAYPTVPASLKHERVERNHS